MNNIKKNFLCILILAIVLAIAVTLLSRLPEFSMLSSMTRVGIFALLSWTVIIFLMTSWVYYNTRDINHLELRGLLLPKGSIRSMLALLIVGFYIIFVVFGYSFIYDIYIISLKNVVTSKLFNDPTPPLLKIETLINLKDVTINLKDLTNSVDKMYQTIITAMTALSGAVIGFYFGGRAATPDPKLLERAVENRTGIIPDEESNLDKERMINDER